MSNPNPSHRASLTQKSEYRILVGATTIATHVCLGLSLLATVPAVVVFGWQTAQLQTEPLHKLWLSALRSDSTDTRPPKILVVESDSSPDPDPEPPAPVPSGRLSPATQLLLQDVAEGRYERPSATNPTPLLSVNGILSVAQGADPSPPTMDFKTFITLDNQIKYLGPDLSSDSPKIAEKYGKLNKFVNERPNSIVTFAIHSMISRGELLRCKGVFLSPRYSGSPTLEPCLDLNVDSATAAQFEAAVLAGSSWSNRTWLVVEGEPKLNTEDFLFNDKLQVDRVNQGYLLAFCWSNRVTGWIKPRHVCLLRRYENGSFGALPLNLSGPIVDRTIWR